MNSMHVDNSEDVKVLIKLAIQISNMRILRWIFPSFSFSFFFAIAVPVVNVVRGCTFHFLECCIYLLVCNT